MTRLPDELANLAQLLRLDMSYNSFLTLPSVVFKMPKLRQLLANNNAIIGKFKSVFFFKFAARKIIQFVETMSKNINPLLTVY